MLFSGIVVPAQNKIPMRIETNCQENTHPFELIQLGTQGLLVFYRTNNPAAKDHSSWEFTNYSINLKPGWTKAFEIPTYYEYKQCVFEKNKIVILFQNSAGKSKGDKISLLIIDIVAQSISSLTEDLPSKASVKRLLVIDSLAIVGYNTPEKQAGFFIKSIHSGIVKHILPEAAQKTWLDDLTIDSLDNEINCLYEYFPERKHSIFRIRQFDLRGNLVDSLPDLDFSNSGQSINSVLLKKFDDKNYLLLGSYSNQPEKTFDEASERIEESTGFFGCLIKEEKITSCNFYNFLSFKNFFNKVRGNQVIYESGKKKNKEISSDYRLIFHPIIEKDGEFYLISEAYYPEYHTVTNWTYDYYGHMIPNSYTVFDGFRYNNTMIAGFDSTATLKWDNSFEINNILTFRLRNRINILFDNNELVFAYNYNGKIGSRLLNKSNTSGNMEYSAIELLSNSDRLVSDDESNMEYWYDNYMLAYGYQQIKNTTRSSSRRYVFYINKIAYR